MPVLLPDSTRPSNLRFHDGVDVKVLESDVYNICDRVKHISPNLYIVVAAEGAKHAFIIMEQCKDRVDRKVFSVNQLDSRVITRLERLMRVPFAQRYAEAEKQEKAMQEAQKEQEFEALYERLGGPMRRQLWHDGFIEHRDKSYPLRRRRG